MSSRPRGHVVDGRTPLLTSKLERQSKPSEKVNIFPYFLDDREQVDLIGRNNLFSLRFMFNSGHKLDFFNWAGSKIGKHGSSG